MRLTSWQGIGLFAIAAVFVAIAFLDTAAPKSCSDADAGRRSNLMKQAEKAYTAILAEEPESTCAREGMGLVVQQLCRRAARTLAAGHPEDAQKAYSAVLAMEPPGALFTECKRRPQAECPAAEACPTGGKPGKQGKPGKRGKRGKRGKPGKDGEDERDSQDDKDARDDKA